MSEVEEKEPVKELTPKESKFVTEYLIDFNGTRAARDSGYSKNCAAEIAYENLRKPHIKAEITKRLKEAELGAQETAKMISDIAKGNLNNYMIVRKVERITKVKKKLEDVIKDLEDEKLFEIEFADQAGLTQEELEDHEKHLKYMDRKILRLQLELKRNPKAYRIVSGPSELVETADLDIAALSRDKEFGKIKSLSNTKDGLKVELYPADAALRDIARMHGMFKDNLDVKVEGSIDPESWLRKNNTLAKDPEQ